MVVLQHEGLDFVCLKSQLLKADTTYLGTGYQQRQVGKAEQGARAEDEMTIFCCFIDEPVNERLDFPDVAHQVVVIQHNQEMLLDMFIGVIDDHRYQLVDIRIELVDGFNRSFGCFTKFRKTPVQCSYEISKKILRSLVESINRVPAHRQIHLIGKIN